MLKQNGAALTTAISEFFVLFYCLIRDKGSIRDYLIKKKAKISLLEALSGVAEIVVISLLFKSFDLPYILRMVLIIFISILAYGAGLLLMGNELAHRIISSVRKRFERNKTT